ncbi:Hypp1769 [Branchiostoma lanceolatum]|uniref:Hypp1769 protein n=1 Tax=Branchiostoma lanceolatum TaxID=7740 RepID=A0A8J9ZKA8_BRALA|nr:Hypp1769 [Branchiostoma lanceolatum]
MILFASSRCNSPEGGTVTAVRVGEIVGTAAEDFSWRRGRDFAEWILGVSRPDSRRKTRTTTVSTPGRAGRPPWTSWETIRPYRPS